MEKMWWMPVGVSSEVCLKPGFRGGGIDLLMPYKADR